MTASVVRCDGMNEFLIRQRHLSLFLGDNYHVSESPAAAELVSVEPVVLHQGAEFLLNRFRIELLTPPRRTLSPRNAA